MNDKLVMMIFIHSTIHMFASKDRDMPIRIVNCTKIWITGAVLCSYVLNLCISIVTDFLLWKVAYISASSYKMMWETLCKARHLGWNMCYVFHHTEGLKPTAWCYKPLKHRISSFPSIWSYYRHHVGSLGLRKDTLYGLHKTTQRQKYTHFG